MEMAEKKKKTCQNWSQTAKKSFILDIKLHQVAKYDVKECHGFDDILLQVTDNACSHR